MYIILYFDYFVTNIAAWLAVILQNLGGKLLIEAVIVRVFFAFAYHHADGRFDGIATNFTLLFIIVTVSFRVYWGGLEKGVYPTVGEIQSHYLNLQKIC